MLAEVIRFDEDATLIMRTGVQFMDFGVRFDPRTAGEARFALPQGSLTPIRLALAPHSAQERWCDPLTQQPMSPDARLEADIKESLSLFAETWLPAPFLLRQGGSFTRGPANWARVQIVPLAAGEDPDGYTHRVVLAFDTSVYDTEIAGGAYLSPGLKDVEAGVRFALAWRGKELAWFCEQKWVSEWVRERVAEGLARRGFEPSDLEKAEKNRLFIAHYLNLLWLLGEDVSPPSIRLISNRVNDVNQPIPVDMVLDVGNSRTFGILVESHPQQGDGLNTRYELELRDMSNPHRVYREPFESRLEFAEATFGKVEQSIQSGRADAFLWPTIARVGPEAARLAARRRGTEGSTGLSSPKRYLWDAESYQPGWRFNGAFSQVESEPHATAAPFGDLINDRGTALFTLPPEEQMQVFVPHYSRSALMTFMLAEVLVQALCQMNSLGQRMKMRHANLPRQLRSVMLTVPPSMPLAEQEMFRQRLIEAVGLVWKALGWHPADAPLPDPVDAPRAWPPLPDIRIQWDEATCAQVVYLYTEVVNNFVGHPEDFFRAARRPRGHSETGRQLRIASVDMGGGTTDLVINDYKLDHGNGSNVYILPEQVFRDGFKVAGDDIVLDIIQKLLIPAVSEALERYGVAGPEMALSRLIGAEVGAVQDEVLRQQLTLQVFYPAALTVLKEYEQYHPQQGAAGQTRLLGALLPDSNAVSGDVLRYFAKGVTKAKTNGGAPGTGFDLLAVPVRVDFKRLHESFLKDQMEISKPIKALCEIAYLYDCDVLLLSGRPSRLPGVQALFRGLLALPPNRVIGLHRYRTGSWYPFHRNGCIDDPKTAAAVGAMLCMLGQGQIPNFFFRANAFKLYSTVRHIGLMDNSQTIHDEGVYYRDVDFDDPDYHFPADEVSFEVRGRMKLGFRQLATSRWGASPLYLIDINPKARAGQDLYGKDEIMVLKVSLRPAKRGDPRKMPLQINSVSRSDGGMQPGRDAVSLRFCTLLTRGMGETSYWLDSGSIKR